MKTKQTQHTPSPWRIKDGETSWIIESDELTHIARIGKAKEGHIDAAFIVRAVNSHEELLEVLKFLLGNHSGIRSGQSGFNFDKVELLAIKQAIAKAEGRS